MDIRPFLPILAIALLVIAASLGLLARRMGQRPAITILAGGLAVLAIVGLVLSVLNLPEPRAPLPGSLSIYYVNDTSNGDTLEAASAATGTVRWGYTPSSVSSFPSLTSLVYNGAFYLTSADGDVRAIRASDGKQLWATPILGEVAEQQVAAVDHGVVYVTSGPIVIALRATDGSQLWQTSFGAVSGFPIWPAQVVNRVVYMAFSTGPAATSVTSIYAFDAADGTIRWTYHMATNSASFTVANGFVYAEFSGLPNGVVVALGASDGSVRWKYPLSPNRGPLAVADGVVYLCDPELGLFALDAMAGRLLWHRRDVGVGQTLIVANGVVYLLATFLGRSPDEAVLALNAQGGGERWRTFLDDTASYMTLAGNMLYIGGYSAYALRSSDGHVVWRYGSGAQFYQPVVSAGVVFIGSTDDSFHLFGIGSNDFLSALDARTGALYWRTSGDVEGMLMLSA